MKTYERKLGVLTGLSEEDLEKLSKLFHDLSVELCATEIDVAKGLLTWVKQGKITTP